MSISKRDSKVIRAVINRLRTGPTHFRLQNPGNVAEPLMLRLEDDAIQQLRVWADTWIASELNNLLPDDEKVKFNVKLT